MRDKDKTKERFTPVLPKMGKQIAGLEISNLEHGRTVQTLQNYVEEYRGLFDSFPIGIAILDMKGFVQYSNPAVYKEGGHSEADILGKHFTKISPIQLKDITRFIRMFNSIIRGKIPKPFETSYDRKDGMVGFTEVHVSLIEIDGKRKGIQVIQRDITENKRAEEAIRQRNKELDIINSIAIGTSQSLDLQQITSSALDDTMKMLDVERGIIYLLDETTQTFVPSAHRGATADGIRSFARFGKNQGLSGHVAMSGKPLVVSDASKDKRSISPPDDKEIPRSWAGIPINSKGKLLGIMNLVKYQVDYFNNVHLDLLARIGNHIGLAVENAQLYQSTLQSKEALQASEEKYRNLVENLPVGISLTNINGAPIECNKALLEMYGYKLKEELMQIPTQARYYNPKDRGHYFKILREQGQVRDFDVQLRSHDGTPFWASLTSIPQNREDQNQLLTVVQDITQEKQAKEELLAYQRELQALTSQLSLAEEQERRRVAIAIHDRLGQSLAVCRFKLGALLQLSPSPELSKELSETDAILKQLVEETRSLTFELSSPLLYEFGLEAALERLTQKMGEQYGVLSHFKALSEPKELDDEIKILLFQCVRELLINVFKHASASNVWVRLDGAKNEIRITVKDDGIGFDSTRLNTDRNSVSGFGLFSVRERLRHLDGNVDIQSESGRGTKVMIAVPIKAGQSK